MVYPVVTERRLRLLVNLRDLRHIALNHITLEVGMQAWESCLDFVDRSHRIFRRLRVPAVFLAKQLTKPCEYTSRGRPCIDMLKLFRLLHNNLRNPDTIKTLPF